MRLTQIVRVVAVWGVMLLATRIGLAQRASNEAGPLLTPISRAEAEKFVKALNLDADQRSSMLMLYKGYREAVKQVVAEADKTEELRQQDRKGDEGGAGKLAFVKKLVEDSRRLETSFFDDVKAILRPEQMALHPRIERIHRRVSGMRFSVASGEGVDLIAITEGLGVKREGSLAEALDDYETRTDKLMVSKNTMFMRLFETATKMENGGMPDMEKMNELIKDLMAHSFKVRDSNTACARLIASTLVDEKRAEFERQVRNASNPRVWGPSYFVRSVDAALKMDGLSAEQKEKLDRLKTSYERDVEPINIKWVAAIDEKQSKMADKGFAMMGELAMMGDDDPLKASRKARIDLDRASNLKLREILSEAQQDALPKQTPAEEEMAQEYAAMRDVMPIDGDEDEGMKDFEKEDE